MEKAVSLNFISVPSDQLQLANVGRSDTLSGHKYGPAVRPYYLIHYILAGSGTFKTDQSIYKLHAGQGFLIEPGQETTYIADKNTPWSYVWIGFSGNFADQLMQQIPLNQREPIFSLNDPKRLIELVNLLLLKSVNSTTKKLLNLSYLLEFLSIISNATIISRESTTSISDIYVEKAISLINKNFPNISAASLAQMIGLDRSYLGKRFKKVTGMTLQTYLKNYKITQARHLIESTNLSLLEISQRCGYQRVDSLARTFKATYGLTPSDFRLQQKELPTL